MGARDKAEAFLREGKEAEAVALVEKLAAAGDAEALFLLADWRLFGLHGPQDFAAAHDCLKRATDAGHVEAARAQAFLTASGTGVPRDFDAAVKMLEAIAPRDPYSALQLKMLPHVLRDARPERQILFADPRIELVKGLLLPEECSYLMTLGEPQLRPGLTVDPATGEGVPNPVRTSYATSILAHQEDLVVQAINRRIAAATGTDVRWGEPLNILRYTPGQEYKPHHDALPENSPSQRIVTALVYLNSDYQGGETHFPLVKVTGRGDVGDALIFRNTLPDGRRDDRAFHAGLPVRAGTKWLATRWIRQTPYVLE